MWLPPGVIMFFSDIPDRCILYLLPCLQLYAFRQLMDMLLERVFILLLPGWSREQAQATYPPTLGQTRRGLRGWVSSGKLRREMRNAMGDIPLQLGRLSTGFKV